MPLLYDIINLAAHRVGEVTVIVLCVCVCVCVCHNEEFFLWCHNLAREAIASTKVPQLLELHVDFTAIVSKTSSGKTTARNSQRKPESSDVQVPFLGN